MKVIYDPRVDKIIRGLPEKHNSRVVGVVDLFIDGGFNLSALYLKKLKSQIWELRAGRYRLLFGTNGPNAVITNIFLKKTQRTPNLEIKLAVQRLKQYEK